MEVLISKEQIGLRLVEIIRDHMLDFLVIHYVLLPIAQYMLAPMRLRLRFLLHYNRNMKDLRTELKNLGIVRIEVQELVDAAVSHSEIILPSVERWQARAINITEDLMYLPDNELHINPMVCCQQSKYAMEKTAEVNKLIQEGESFDSLSTLRSRISIFEDIMEELKYGETNRIGIFGEAGVGKTFLADEIYKEAKDGDGDPFEEVVMATVSSRPDLEGIKCEIAKMLGLRFDELSKAERARQLSKIFDGRRRILIILDDVHQNFELEAVGIHFRERYKGCKIVLVSRSEDVCYHFCTEMKFPIVALDEEEKWILFQKIAGVPVHPQNPLAVEAARNCAGLPRDIMTAARAWNRNAARNF